MTYTVSLYHPEDAFWIDESPINQWLVNTVGKCAMNYWNEQVSQSHPWSVRHYTDRLTYHFYREADAITFALRWS